MKNMIEQEIASLNAEINVLVQVRRRLENMLMDAPPVDAAEPKKRGRKKKPGLPSATPPASEANHAPSKTEKDIIPF